MFQLFIIFLLVVELTSHKSNKYEFQTDLLEEIKPNFYFQLELVLEKVNMNKETSNARIFESLYTTR